MRLPESPDLHKVLLEAEKISRLAGGIVCSTHYLLAFCEASPNPAEQVILRKGLDEDGIADLMFERADLIEEPPGILVAIKDKAQGIAESCQSSKINSLHLLYALTSVSRSAAYRLMESKGIAVARFRAEILSYLSGNMPRWLKPYCRPYGSCKSSFAFSGIARDDRPLQPELSGVEMSDSVNGGAEAIEEQVQEEQVGPPMASLASPEVPAASGDGPSLHSQAEVIGETVPASDLARQQGKTTTATMTTGPAASASPFGLNKEEYPFLLAHGRNLSLDAYNKKLDPLIGGEREVERLLDVLNKRRSNNPCVVGDPGVGKTAMVEGLARSLMKEQLQRGVPGERIIVELNIGKLISGTQLRGSFAEKMIGIKEEVHKASGRVIIFFDEVHNLVGAGASGDAPQDAANDLKAALSRGQFPCIGATTPDEYRRSIEADKALARRFQPVFVEEPNEATTLEILRGVVGRYAQFHRVEYLPEAIEAALSMSVRYITERCLPDKAITIIDEAGGRARREGREIVDRVLVSKVVSGISRIPVEKLLVSDRRKLLKMEELLAAEYVGHRDIVNRICDAIRRNYAGFHSQRPIGSFLYLGPTGVGKTELVKVLAQHLFDDRDAVIRLDMSEFTEAHSLSKLIGAPPGYKGHEQGGRLTEEVRRRPYRVVLFDEMEKAHREVLLILLQILDEGRLTDSLGRRVDFSHTLVILTSNIGAEIFGRQASRIGFGAEDKGTSEKRLEQEVLDAARQSMPIELWNRIEHRLVFSPLSPSEIREVARLKISRSSERLQKERGIAYVVEDAALGYLLDHGGYDPELGARPMRQTIERLIESEIAMKILRGEFSAGDTVDVTCGEQGLSFRVRS